MAGPKITRATLVPVLRYRDSTRAVAWLCENFGFAKHAYYEDETGTCVHAELAFGNGMIMIGPVRDTAFGKFMVQPDEIGGRQTQSLFAIVADPDAHCAKAKAAGAEIVMELRDESYGGREYTCRDLEGHIWTFSTYDPWSTGPG